MHTYIYLTKILWIYVFVTKHIYWSVNKNNEFGNFQFDLDLKMRYYDIILPPSKILQLCLN